MKYFVIGPRGMLGRYVSRYLSGQGHEVVEVDRNILDATRVSHETLNHVLFVVGARAGDVVINCAGCIKPVIDQYGPLKALLVNSVFPRVLADVCGKIGVSCVHPTTDCVFSGFRGNYLPTDPHDVTDVYGRTKSLGEAENATVIRTSIIGEEVGQSRSLVEWVRSKTGQTVSGYTNHRWNGITCLQFAKVVEKLTIGNGFWQGVQHVTSPEPIIKGDLVSMISEVYGFGVTVVPTEAPVMCDRTLSGEIELGIPSLRQQVEEMKGFGSFLRL